MCFAPEYWKQQWLPSGALFFHIDASNRLKLHDKAEDSRFLIGSDASSSENGSVKTMAEPRVLSAPPVTLPRRGVDKAPPVPASLWRKPEPSRLKSCLKVRTGRFDATRYSSAGF
jgi:hypothetical protein